MIQACPEAALIQGKPVIAGSAIVMRLESGLVAYRNACPHMGIQLDWDARRLLSRSGRYLQCTGHGALFEPATGRCVRGPCAGEALTPVGIRIESDMVLLDD